MAKKLNLDGYLANVSSHEKRSKVKEFQDRGYVTAMVGDGINDALVLAQAHLGSSVGSGTDVATSMADAVLVNSDPVDAGANDRFWKSDLPQDDPEPGVGRWL